MFQEHQSVVEIASEINDAPVARVLRFQGRSARPGETAMPRHTPFESPARHTAAPVAPAAPTVLIVPGLNGSCDAHWQSAWEREREDCVRADLGQWADPTPARWIARLENAVRDIPGPVILAAHSLGCITTALWANGRRNDDHVVGALLVAPCDPEAPDACARLRRFAPAPVARLPFPTTVIASTNDPYASIARSREMAAAWGADFADVGALGHINAKSDIGAWPAGQAFLHKFLGK